MDWYLIRSINGLVDIKLNIFERPYPTSGNNRNNGIWNGMERWNNGRLRYRSYWSLGFSEYEINIYMVLKLEDDCDNIVNRIHKKENISLTGFMYLKGAIIQNIIIFWLIFLLFSKFSINFVICSNVMWFNIWFTIFIVKSNFYNFIVWKLTYRVWKYQKFLKLGMGHSPSPNPTPLRTEESILWPNHFSTACAASEAMFLLAKKPFCIFADAAHPLERVFLS